MAGAHLIRNGNERNSQAVGFGRRGMAVLTGFALLRRAPLALGMLGMTWGLVAVAGAVLASSLPAPGHGGAVP